MISSASASPESPLPPCSSSPNCVSSNAGGSYYIDPFVIKGDPKTAFARLASILSKRKDTSIISADDSRIRVEFRTILGFVDDGLFILDQQQRIIQIRSAARLGYWDLGKNRRRLEEIRREFVHATPD